MGGLPGHASTSTAKPNIHGKKFMLCIWWDQLGVVYYELHNPSETVTGTLYRTQLMRLSRALKEKRSQFYSRHDIIILLHAIMLVRISGSDIAPSNYHLFRLMTHALSEHRFTSYVDTKNWVDSWIASKDKEFFRL
ncbi:Mariner Mos1 transposase [Eumeta japonica]|uniref:Mariner Mos1 transposase n=1 Tax=Eumeta variegata TaxID=151549 RepID=A0A4C1ZYX3_EUMVA|nr:Mariner Mos1 transposase [Eumeta japonica]